ncbi:MAG TPA: lysine--tRNA ligase [Candidatus Binatia bacterium]|jgi:lysyl-tRNA synthetase class 2|nr:lysine--tRNA ligase [Candidatus Binatia bacterium]
MPDDHEQIVVRRRKLSALREQGANPFPNDFRPDHTAGEVHARYGALDEAGLSAIAPLRVAGRITALRDFGKAGFVRIQDRGESIQVHARRDRLGDDAFAVYRALDVGDLVGVAGTPFRTRTNELTIAADGLQLLVKSLRPLPEKWHGLQDVEARYRQRYLDLIVNPDARRIFAARAGIIRGLRTFLGARDYVEVETPMMQGIAGGAAARPFVTHHNALDIELFLRIAPELYLKRLVVGGFDRVFELGRVFRNEGLSTRHNPEFTMLEFYQAYATYEDLMDLTEEMLVAVAEQVTGSLQLTYGDLAIDLTPPWPRRSMAELVAERAEVPVERLFDGDTIRDLARATGGIERASMTTGDLLGVLFERLVEPHLVQPTFVCQFPVEMSPLARRNDRDPRFVDRFELYIARHEIANAFSELNDPDDQRERFQAQLAAKAAGDDEAHAMDEDYVRALEYGLPPTAGEGIGIDRLVMLLTGATSIREVILFPQLRPESRE